MSQAGIRRRGVAHALGLTLDELKALQLRVAAAGEELDGLSKAERLAASARRLSITPPELKALRSAMNSSHPASAAVRSTARHVVSLDRLRSSFAPERPPPARPAEPQAPSRKTAPPNPAARSPRGPVIEPVRWVTAKTPRSFRDWDGDTNVFVVEWGDVVHLYADCSGARGFRHANEPDPVIIPARLRDPVCAARRACRKCFNVWSNSTIDDLDVLLENLHGSRSARSKPSSRSRNGPVVIIQGPRPMGPQATNPSASTKKASAAAKAARRKADAARLGITVDELKARRRAENEANRAKKKR